MSELLCFFRYRHSASPRSDSADLALRARRTLRLGGGGAGRLNQAGSLMHCTRVCSLWQVSRQSAVPESRASLSEGGLRGLGLPGEPSCDMMTQAPPESLLPWFDLLFRWAESEGDHE